MATYAKKSLYKMQNLYLPQPGVEEFPYEKLALDFNLDTPPLYDKNMSICKYIAEFIFLLNNQRKPTLKSIPNNISDFIIPAPIYR